MACPNGTVWCLGPTGPSNSPKCRACQQAMVRAPAGPPAAAPLPPVLAHVAVSANPRENLVGRGATGTTMHLGVGEQVDLVNPMAPAGWTFKWAVQGDADGQHAGHRGFHRIV